MNYNNMTFDEILRIAEPTTELERVLIARFEDELEEKAEEISDAFRQNQIDELYEAKERIEYLEEVLDEHEIKYDK